MSYATLSAYGHSHLGEWLLGDVSLTLRVATLPGIVQTSCVMPDASSQGRMRSECEAR